ncbi:MAG: guanylate kinase [Oligoflexia bacterium]|nr:guanylate kinase [Oligoflexia bacterium]
MLKMAKLIIIVAPSGAGKSTLISLLKKDFPQIKVSVSYTTRDMRKGEVDGKNYFFVTKDDFFSRRDRGEFVEWAEVHANYYGTSKIFIEKQLEQGVYVLLDIDVQGVDNIKKIFGQRAQAIFIAPPSIDELERRLKARGTDAPEVIARRVENAKKELLRKNDYDFLVTNEFLEESYNTLKNIVKSIIDSPELSS